MTKQEQYLYNEVIELTQEMIRLKDELTEIKQAAYRSEYERASADPTGQDLDQFLERFSEPDNYDHIECPIQRDELRMGA